MSERDTRAVELLVGKIGRAHGIRGDVAIDVRTDEPERRFAAGTVVHDAARHGHSDCAARWHGQRLLATLCRGALIERRRATARDRAARHRRCRRATRGPEEFYDHQLVGLVVVDLTECGLGRIAEVLAPAGPRRLRGPARSTIVRSCCRSSPRWCRRSTSARAESWLTRRLDCSTRTRRRWLHRTRRASEMRIDVVSIFPEYFAPLELSLLGRARVRRPGRPAYPRPPVVDPRPASNRGRHPVRRGSRHGDDCRSRGVRRSTS